MAGADRGNQPQRHRDTEKRFLSVSLCLCGQFLCAGVGPLSDLDDPQHHRPDDSEGLRLDRFLVGVLPEHSRSQISG